MRGNLSNKNNNTTHPIKIINKKQQLLLKPFSEGGELTESEGSRLVAALQAVFSSSFSIVNNPLDIDVADAGTQLTNDPILVLNSLSIKNLLEALEILRTHLRSVDTVFKFKIWQSSVAMLPNRVCEI